MCESVKTLILKDYYFGLMVGCFPQYIVYSADLLVQFILKSLHGVSLLCEDFGSAAAARSMSLEMTLCPLLLSFIGC